MTGSRPQLYNGLILIAMFFCCRLVWGTHQSYTIYKDLWAGIHTTPIVPATVAALTGNQKAADNFVSPERYNETMRFVTTSTTIPTWLAVIYVGSNLTLNSLNFYWFFKMIDAVRKRFEPPASAKIETDTAKVKGAAGGTGAITTGTDVKVTTRPRRRTLLDGEDSDAAPAIS